MKRTLINIILYPLLLIISYKYAVQMQSSILSILFWIIFGWIIFVFVLSLIYRISLYFNDEEKRKNLKWILMINSYLLPLGTYSRIKKSLEENAAKNELKTKDYIVKEVKPFGSLVVIYILIMIFRNWTGWGFFEIIFWLCTLGIVLSIYIGTIAACSDEFDANIEKYGFEWEDSDIRGCLTGIILGLYCFFVFSNFVPIPQNMSFGLLIETGKEVLDKYYFREGTGEEDYDYNEEDIDEWEFLIHGHGH